jgi:hypothetical protein
VITRHINEKFTKFVFLCINTVRIHVQSGLIVTKDRILHHLYRCRTACQTKRTGYPRGSLLVDSLAQLDPEQYSHKPLQTHQPATSGYNNFSVEFYAAGSKYFARETSTNLLTRNPADWMQRQRMGHCNTSSYFSKRFQHQFESGIKSVQRLSSAIVTSSELFELRIFPLNY